MTLKTLVVDNNPVLLKAISALLAKQGCEVETATNGLEALNILKWFQPDILFTDLVMPLVGGEQLCKIIRNTPALSEIYIVVVSGIVQEDFEKILPTENYDSCIAKGTLKEIGSHIREVIARVEEYRLGGERLGSETTAMIPKGYERSAVTTELLSEKKHLSTILENLEEGIVELDVSGRVVSANLAAVRILGVKEEVFIGSRLADYPWPEYGEEIVQWLETSRAQKNTASFEIRDDKPLQIKGRIITASFFMVRGENAAFTMCIFRDISRQYLAEEHERELNQALTLLKKMESMSSMAGGIAHDFNNLLTVVCGNLDIVVHKKESDISEENLQLLNNARTAAYKVVDLTRKISCFSPFGIISRERIKFEAFVQQVVYEFFKEVPVKYELFFESDNSLVEIDGEQMQTAVRNVLQNSLEASPGGEIVITVSEKELEQPQITSGQYVPAGRYGCVEVKDNGSGIESENILEIFDPYYSTKARGATKGMGLGLTVVYATMRNHRGYVVVESEKDVGTRVQLYLPLNTSQEEVAVKGEDLLAERNLLLIENDKQLQEIFKVMLEFIGYGVTVSDSIREGRAEFEKALVSDEKKIAVIFIDPSQHEVQFPREICDMFHSMDPSCKIVATGDSALNPALKNCKKYGFANVLHKPFSFEEVKSVMVSVEG